MYLLSNVNDQSLSRRKICNNGPFNVEKLFRAQYFLRKDGTPTRGSKLFWESYDNFRFTFLRIFMMLLNLNRSDFVQFLLFFPGLLISEKNWSEITLIKQFLEYLNSYLHWVPHLFTQRWISNLPENNSLWEKKFLFFFKQKIVASDQTHVSSAIH